MSPFRETHSCLVNENATEIVGEKEAKTKWGIMTFVMARLGNKVVVRSIKIPGTVPVSTAQNLCKVQGGQFSPATPLNPQQQLLSEEYCFVKLSDENKREVLRVLVRDFEIYKGVEMPTLALSEQYELEDSAFAFILPGGYLDITGRTIPRSLRKLPYKNVRGVIQGNLLTEALRALPQAVAPAKVKREGLTKLIRAAITVNMDVQCAANFRLSDLDYYLQQLQKVGG